MFCGTAIPRPEKHRKSKHGLDMGDDRGGWSRSTDFVIVVPGPFWRKVFRQKWASGKKGPTTEGDALEEKNQTYQGRKFLLMLESLELRLGSQGLGVFGSCEMCGLAWPFRIPRVRVPHSERPCAK
jgi:hypothetical protein